MMVPPDWRCRAIGFCLHGGVTLQESPAEGNGLSMPRN
jgi:hypothetical protein